MTLKPYTFNVFPEDIDKARKISKKEERGIGWILREIIKYGVNNWERIRQSN